MDRLETPQRKKREMCFGAFCIRTARALSVVLVLAPWASLHAEQPLARTPQNQTKAAIPEDKNPQSQNKSTQGLRRASQSNVPKNETARALKSYSLTLVSHEPLQIAPKEDKEWYERGLWPLVGAVGAIVLTNAVAVGLVYLQSSKSFKAFLRQRKLEALSASLNEFYNPLLALVDINKEIFTKTGPPSFPAEEIARNAAALVWKETKSKILNNNQQLEIILKTKTHLLHETDSIEAYHALMIHVAMYETFQKIETDLYRQFSFPRQIREHIFEKRSLVLMVFNKLSGEQK